MAGEADSDADTDQQPGAAAGLYFEWPIQDLHLSYDLTAAESGQDEPRSELPKLASITRSSDTMGPPLRSSVGTTIPEDKPWPHGHSGTTTPEMLESPNYAASPFHAAREEQVEVKLPIADAEFLTDLEWVNDALLLLEGPLSPAAPSSPDLGATWSLPDSGYTTPSHRIAVPHSAICSNSASHSCSPGRTTSQPAF